MGKRLACRLGSEILEHFSGTLKGIVVTYGYYLQLVG